MNYRSHIYAYAGNYSYQVSVLCNLDTSAAGGHEAPQFSERCPVITYALLVYSYLLVHHEAPKCNLRVSYSVNISMPEPVQTVNSK